MRCRTALFLVLGLTFLAASQSPAQQTSNQNRTTGQATTSGSSFGATSQLSETQGNVGQITGTERFLRENRQPGQMVGAGTAGVGVLSDQTASPDAGAAGSAGSQNNRFGSQGRTTGQFGNQTGGRFGSQFGNQFGNMFNSQMNSQLRNRQRQNLRVPIEVGFNTASLAPQPAVVTTRVQNRLDRITRIRDMGSVSVAMEGQVAVLRGQVATGHDRDLVAKMLLLEPGIGAVRNELAVAAPAALAP